MYSDYQQIKQYCGEEEAEMKGIPVTLEIAAVTDIGRRRSRNEDNFFVNGCFVDHYKVTAERFGSSAKTAFESGKRSSCGIIMWHEERKEP